MKMNRKSIYTFLLRLYSTKAKPQVIPNETLISKIESNECKARKHPGISKAKTIVLPDDYTKAIQTVLEDAPVKALLKEAESFSRYLKAKHPPMEFSEQKEIARKLSEKVISKYSPVKFEDDNKKKQFIDNKIRDLISKKIYNWQPVNYNQKTSLIYLLCRSAPEFSVLYKIFSEIEQRDKEFKPRSLFDFGSGVGNVSWAANMFWKESFFEYVNIDSSRDMNDLAQILLKGGVGTKKDPRGVFYRQFLPSKHTLSDLVTSAYTLLELPSQQARLETVLNLWQKTRKYLVLVENGTNAGFKVINEARDFLLQNGAYMFSPCPHDDLCPRYVEDDGTPCNFEVSYFSLPIGAQSSIQKELYCYVVLQKNPREGEDCNWPRLVRPTLVRSKHTICRMCTAEGKIEEVIFTASKHGKTTYHCARSSKWGDRLPFTVLGASNSTSEND